VTKHDAERKVKILDFIAATLRARGFPPSVREIAKAVGLASTSAVHHHLLILEREGYLERGAAQSRAIRLTPYAALRLGLAAELVPQSAVMEAHTLPVIGEIAAGGPIEAYQDASETVGIPEMLAPSGDAYVLKVRGDSMIDEQIRDGDYVIVEDRRDPSNGEMVIALLNGADVTLKKMYREQGRIRLQPANPTMQPIFAEPDQVQVQGVVVGVLRRY
jgi:repressor LexA